MAQHDGLMVSVSGIRGRVGAGLTPVVPGCTLDLVQMPNGSIVFSDAGAIYRLAPA